MISPEKFIEQYQVNDYEVLTDTGWVDIVASHKTIPFQKYIIKTESFKLKCANTHLLFDKNFEIIPTEKIKNNDKIQTSNGLEKVKEISKTNEKEHMYDLQLDEDSNHRYYTSGILSHNTNIGKTLILCHIAAALTKAGYNVVYFTAEMAENRIAQRVDANLLDVSIKELPEIDKKKFFSRMKSLYDKTSGQLFFKEYPTSTANANHLKIYLKELKTKKNVDIDFIIVDYLNIFQSHRVPASRSMDSYGYVKATAEEMRAICSDPDIGRGEEGIGLITATQTNREGAKKSVDKMDDTDTGECLSPLTLVRTETEKEIFLHEVKVGDKLLGNENHLVEVLKVFSKRRKKGYKITTASGKIIICSVDHEFPTSNGIKTIKTGLNVGTLLKKYVEKYVERYGKKGNELYEEMIQRRGNSISKSRLLNGDRSQKASQESLKVFEPIIKYCKSKNIGDIFLGVDVRYVDSEKSCSSINFDDEIIEIEELEDMDMIDIEVSGDHFFYANDILTKNSFGVPMTVDWQCGVIQTPELFEQGKYIIKVLKTRFDDNNNKVYTIGVDRSRMRLYNLEEHQKAIPLHVKERLMKEKQKENSGEAGFDFEDA